MDSLRFPGKVLWKFHNMPMIEHVYRRACMALSPKDIYITSGDVDILSHMESIGANVIKSNRFHGDGTSRAAEAAESLNYEYVIVLQADEILIDPEHLSQLVKSIINSSGIEFWNLVTYLNTEEELLDPNIVKCACDNNENILFIFRSNPFVSLNYKIFSKIMGTIAFERTSLLKISSSPEAPLQIENSTEQLKILENGYRIKAIHVNNGYPSINSRKDIESINMYIENDTRQIILIDKYIDARA